MDEDLRDFLPEELPGHLIRRMQQLSVSLFLQALKDLDITPIQYLALAVIRSFPGIDQASLAGRMALDTSTVADVARRLAGKDLIVRERLEMDRRIYALRLTPQGETMLRKATPLVKSARSDLLAPLDADERTQLIHLMVKVLQRHDTRYSLETGAPWRRMAPR